jgi:hypothetical protein
MNYKMFDPERSKSAMEDISKQPIFTLEQMKEQVMRVKTRSLNNEKQPITDEEITKILNETYGCDSM